MNVIRPISGFTAEQLIDKLARARGQLRALIDCLPENGWLGPRAGHLNPPLWEYGHIVWFQERWCLREQPDGRCAASLLPGVDDLYDSSNVPHDSRWDLPLLEPAAVDDYASRVSDGMTSHLRSDFSDERAYFAELCIYHELMHIEAWWMAFQNLGYAPPSWPEPPAGLPARSARLEFAGSELVLGSGDDEGFIFDNEKWRHTTTLPAFDIDAHPLSEAVFAEFVDAGGYERSAGWSEMGWTWREASGASHPAYWRKNHGAWQVRRFTNWTPIDPAMPMLHVNRHEAEACAAWLGRRLPTAGEWLRATDHGDFRWGSNWEWMRDPFAPYPGFSADPYRDYSQPWFHTHSELRGGGPVTDPHLKRPGFRNFYLPHRRDPFAGFRTASPI
jgi:iron(II)-dependent oxidoreductase